METTLHEEKQLTRVSGHLLLEDAAVDGYEIHMGISRGEALQRPLIRLESSTDGAVSEDDQVLGTYLHGLFDHPEAAGALLRWAGLKEAEGIHYTELRDREIDRLADVMEQQLDMERLKALLE